MIFSIYQKRILLFFVLITLFSAGQSFAQKPDDSDVLTAKNFEILSTREFAMKNCIQMYFKNKFVIKTEAEFQSAIRKDAGQNYCTKKLEKIDFGKNSLLGIDINSGYCRRPLLLEHQFLKDATNKKYKLKISYIDPQGQVCRALSSYHLWVLVPKIQENFDVEFDVKPTP